MTSDPNCIFCKIIAGTIPSVRLYEDHEFICIRDIQPQAKAHFLVLPKQHIKSLDDAFPVEGRDQTELMGRLMRIGTLVARQQGLLPSGFRAVINTNHMAGQTVDHLHLHILGGEPLAGGFGR
jgi:histidine triad (HIT) family protein